MLYLRTDQKQNCFQEHSFNPSPCRNTGIVPPHGEVYELTFYLWLWNKIPTHPNFSFKGLLLFCQWGHLRIQLRVLYLDNIALSKEIDFHLIYPLICSSQTEELLSKLSLNVFHILKSYTLLLFFLNLKQQGNACGTTFKSFCSLFSSHQWLHFLPCSVSCLKASQTLGLSLLAGSSPLRCENGLC